MPHNPPDPPTETSLAAMTPAQVADLLDRLPPDLLTEHERAALDRYAVPEPKGCTWATWRQFRYLLSRLLTHDLVPSDLEVVVRHELLHGGEGGLAGGKRAPIPE